MQRLPRNVKAQLLPGVALLCVLSIGPSFFAALEGKWPFDDDAIALFGPWRVWAREVLSSGILPLWNPHSFLGMPFMSNGQTAVLYPPNVLYWLLPIHAAMLLDALFHSLLLGVGGYLLARALGRSQNAAWLCAMCLVLAGGVSAHLYAGHLTWHAARAYLPLILWALISFLRGAKPQYLWAMAVFFALQVFAGYPPYVLWSVCWCAVFFAAWMWASPGSARAIGRSLLSPRVLLAGLLLVLLCGAAVLPLRETSALSTHGAQLSFEHASLPSSTLAGWVRLALPNFFGGNRIAQWSILKFPHEEAAYIGLLPLGLAMLAPLLWRRQGDGREIPDEPNAPVGFEPRRFVHALWLVLPLALVLALGKYTPLYRILFDALPPLRMFRVPARWFEIWYFAACVLAAFGWDAFVALPAKSAQRAFTAVAIVALLLMGCAVAIKISSPDSFLWLQIAQWNKGGINADFAERLQYANYLQLVALESVVVAASVLLGLLFLWRRLQDASGGARALWMKSILVLVACDLLVVFWSSARFARDDHPKNPWPRGIESYYRDGDRWNTAFKGAAAGYGLDQGLMRKIDLLGGYDAIASKDFFELASAIEGYEMWSSQYQAETLDPLLKTASITHIFASHNSPLVTQLPQHGAKLLAKFGSGKAEMQLWKLSESWPRVFLTSNILRAPRERQLSVLRELATRITPGVVINENAFPEYRAPVAPTGRVLKRHTAENISVIEVETSAPQILVQSEAFSPGWRAWISGKPVKVERANFLFRSVQVPAGKSRVVFVYDNQTYRFGVFLSLLGLALLAGTISFAASNRRTRPTAAATSNSPS